MKGKARDEVGWGRPEARERGNAARSHEVQWRSGRRGCRRTICAASGPGGSAFVGSPVWSGGSLERSRYRLSLGHARRRGGAGRFAGCVGRCLPGAFAPWSGGGSTQSGRPVAVGAPADPHGRPRVQRRCRPRQVFGRGARGGPSPPRARLELKVRAGRRRRPVYYCRWPAGSSRFAISTQAWAATSDSAKGRPPCARVKSREVV
jgi:hypothetical protein